MKFKFLALTMCALTLACASIHAKNTRVLTPKKAKKAMLLSKEKSGLQFFGASDGSTITLASPTTAWTPLTFTKHKHFHGDSIKPNAAGDTFLLETGTYYVTFTGTFSGAITQNGQDEGVFYNVALQLGPNVIFINTDSQEPNGFESACISTISKVIQVTSPTNLSIVAMDTNSDITTVNVTTRSISIERFE
jgi:hypothetical protein